MGGWGGSDNSPVLSPPSHMWFVKLCQRTKSESEAVREEEIEGVCAPLLTTETACVCVYSIRGKALRMSGEE